MVMPGDVDEVALAKELGVELTEPPATPPPPEHPPKGEETPKPPPDETKPPEGVQPPPEEKKDGEEEPKGEPPPDPLAQYAKGKDPKDALKGLLANPELGPLLNQWADLAAKAQLKTAADRAKGTAESEAQKAQEEKEDKLFEGLSQEELAAGLSDAEHGKENAAAYGRYQLRKQQPKTGMPSEEEMSNLVAVHATGSIIKTYIGMVDDSGLSPEKKAELQPGKFAHLPDALVVYGKTVYEALVEDGVQKRFEAEWESVKETRLAELDPTRPDLSAGRRPGQMLDVMGTDSSEGLKHALALEEQKRNKT